MTLTPDLRARAQQTGRRAGTDLATRGAAIPALQSKMDYAKVLATSGLLPKDFRDKPANLLWAVEYGEMLGLSPMAAVTGIHVIEGKPGASAHLIAALVRRAGHKLRIQSGPDRAVAQVVRKDDPEYVFRAEWDTSRAQAAGLLNKDNWKKHRAQMLAARAVAEVGRMACSDVLMGLYSTDELGDDGWEAADFVVEAQPAVPTTVDLQTGELPPDAPALDDEPDDPMAYDELRPEAGSAAPAEEMVTKAQAAKIHAMLGGLGIRERDGRLQYLARTLEREVASTDDLTKAEAGRVIETLEQAGRAES